MSWIAIAENLVADLIFLGAGAILATLILLVTRWTRRARLLRYLGITVDSPVITVYFSTLNVPPFQSLDFNGVARSYSGAAIPEGEYREVLSVSRALQASAVDWLTALLLLALQQVPVRKVRGWFGPRTVTVKCELSPIAPTPLPAEATICLGSPGYNYATHHYLSALTPRLDFVLTPTPAIQPPGGLPIVYSGDVGMLQRLDSGSGFPVFIAAGLGVNGTIGALRYLLTRWQELDRRFGSQAFGIALGFPPAPADPLSVGFPVPLGTF